MLSTILTWLIPVASAQNLQNVGSANPGVAGMWARICSTLPFCGLGTGATDYFALRILDFLFSIIVVLAIGVLIYAGIRMIVSQGDESAMEEAKKIVIYALGGLVAALIAEALLTYIMSVVLPQLLG